jgi:hypothetical protein
LENHPTSPEPRHPLKCSAARRRDGFQGTRQEPIDQHRLPGQRLQGGPLRQWYDNDYNNFSSHFGFAWAPFKDRRTSIRGGYGVFYDRIIRATASTIDGNTPGFL